ncbi:MAG TPA: UDP-N-acetylmuramoyl-tripeptide--D-alanyl-D-alanine ligase [Clostridiales bacterium]|nr:UDP-N-acetylmuramoyl-tripeptide--D-alanyl-D-alanine ligase [Clostridiales bacterium]HCS10496.1 UDP-N-acetylmuramoyl-tripeptide--D-alanyl-D-alanine ligase [Clostridiales bacterium]
MLIITSLYIFFWIYLCELKIKQSLHIIQLEGYNSDKYIDWIGNNKDKVHTKNDKTYAAILIIFSAILTIISPVEKTPVFPLIYAVISLFFLIKNVRSKEESKKPLVFTPRAKRLYGIAFFLVLFDLILTLLIVKWITKDIFSYLPVWAGIITIIYYFSSFYMYGANYIAKPMEERINKKYYIQASEKIKNMNINSVGITGSYGKTSTKFITETILKEKYKVLKTPESYNTPMGISKIINNELTDEYDVFIAELGATKSGDIDEVAKLTNPKLGIITSIGPCHLESFKSIDNIMRTKYELIENLPDDGTAIFNYDNEYVKKLADKTFKHKLLYGIDNIEETDIFATDMHVDSLGSSFALCINSLGTIECRTKLLGRHNILNILGGAAIASALGLSLNEIKTGISMLEPVEHRLQLIDHGTGVLVIDDAFNSNPEGAQAALDVLNSFTDRRKIIVTPGMIELGSIEEEENYKLGEIIASVCDVAILVGEKRTLPIYQGMEKHDFNEDNLYVVNSLNEAAEVLKTLTKVNDVVLFENDLPDTYDEK